MSEHGMYGANRKAVDPRKAQESPKSDTIWEKKFAGHTIESDLRLLDLAALPTDAGHVMQQWRAQVKLKFTDAGFDMDLLKQARDRLMLAIEKGAHARINQLEESACKTCGGSGRIGVGFGHECPTCKGTGAA